MRRAFAACLLSLLLTACGSKPQPPGSKVFPFPYSLDDLPNGLRVVTAPTGFPNLVALYIVVQTGSRNEIEAGKSGFAHLFEHVMFRGTERFPAEKYEGVLQAAGAQSNAFTSDDVTAYHNVFAKEDLESILEIEADRFQNLKYSQEHFKTETRAVLGEYNKNSANPFVKLEEAIQEKAFARHTYQHTTMGFLRDIEDMPNQYDYSRTFFDRWYRPEYTIVCVAGDVERGAVLSMVRKHFGGWKRGSYKAEIPAEPPQTEAKTTHVEWPTPTLPLVAVAFKAAAYDDETKDSAILDVAAYQAFSENSDLYRKLVIDEQKVDLLNPDNSDHVDPYLFTVTARVKDAKDTGYVQERLLAAFEELREKTVPAARLEEVKSNLRYEFALQMNSTAAVGRVLAPFLALRRTPETINKRYALYQTVTPAEVQAAARKYFVPQGRTIATLAHKGAVR